MATPRHSAEASLRVTGSAYGYAEAQRRGLAQGDVEKHVIGSEAR